MTTEYHVYLSLSSLSDVLQLFLHLPSQLMIALFMLQKTILLFAFLLIMASCTTKVAKDDFAFFLEEPTMLINHQQDNTLEGDYFIVAEVDSAKGVVFIDLPNDFYLSDSNCAKWVIGWGKQMPYYNAGVENIRSIRSIDNNQVVLGELERGSGFPSIGQHIAFWNTSPSGFVNIHKDWIINPQLWPEFKGNSIAFGGVAFDSLIQKWVMLVHEVDTHAIQIYAALSEDLIHWNAANKGAPILKAADFANCSWAGHDKSGKHPQTAMISDIVRYKKQWYIFMDGYDNNGKRHIGLATAQDSLTGSYIIHPQPILSCGSNKEWNNEAVFYAKVENNGKHFVMLYDGRNSKEEERVGIATSHDLFHWKNATNNPVIDQHVGWRSALGNTEPAYLQCTGDTILALIGGAKAFNNSLLYHLKGNRNMGRAGNVFDSQLGAYLSTDGGKHFVAHKHNPVFANDYSNPYENEHLGGNFELIQTDTSDFIIYQAKNAYVGYQYSILLRERKK